MGKRKKELKFLLLGPAKSGKTTFIKHLKMAYSPNEHPERYRNNIYKNIFKPLVKVWKNFKLNMNAMDLVKEQD